MDPVCGLEILTNETRCKTYVCPTCYAAFGMADCGELAAPADVCLNYVPKGRSAFDACETRPFAVCSVETSGSFHVSFVDHCRGECESGDLIELSEGSECSEFKPDMRQIILRSVLTAACTFPVIAILSMAFDTLRAPVTRGIEGERQHVWLSCKKKQSDTVDEIQALPGDGQVSAERKKKKKKRVNFVSAARLQAEHPERLRHKSWKWAGCVHLLAAAVGILCTVLIALVVVTFDVATTREWCLALAVVAVCNALLSGRYCF